MQSRVKGQSEDRAGAKTEAGAQNPFVSQAYATADILLLDEDDMVQKGCGWMLKELAESRPREVFEFVMAQGPDAAHGPALRHREDAAGVEQAGDGEVSGAFRAHVGA